ncbi:MAG: iron hydrogenase small subunit [Spirochaetaceae bacterium]|jgi:ferredoxin hydrogenase|nr:iron hydrogenase small subunit [Spirochaetaceae bacterium]
MTVVTIDKDICTGCQECAKVCPVYAIEGNPREPQKIIEERCVNCGQCVQKCKSYVSLVDHGSEFYAKKRAERRLPETVSEPLFAAHNVCHLDEVISALSGSKFTMVMAAPAVRVALAEDFGLPLGSLTPGKMAAAMRRIGFKRVYDTNWSADLTIMEEGTELVKRVAGGGVLPMFTSCCPAWVKYMEDQHPSLTKHLSSCRSPQQMSGSMFKTYGAKINKVDPKDIFLVSVMPCTAKQFECSRPEMNASGQRDVDVAITTRELAYLIRYYGVDFNSLPDEEFDMPLGDYTGAGTIFGVTGGVMEAAIRTGYTLVTGKELSAKDVDIKAVRGTEGFHTAEIKVGDLTLKVGVLTYLKNIDPLIEKLKAGALDLHFIEVMSCPEGCVSGGGQPKLVLDTDVPEAYKNRRGAIFEHDKNLPKRKSHENPSIKKVYDDFLKEPCGEKSHHLLHTVYKGSGSHH